MMYKMNMSNQTFLQNKGMRISDNNGKTAINLQIKEIVIRFLKYRQ